MLKSFFLQFITLIKIVVVIISCHPEKQDHVRSGELRFATSDASELFFRNVRKSYYDVQEMPGTGLEIYTLIGAPDGLLRPRIILNWRTDHAFLMLELPDSLPDQLTLVRIGNEEDSLVFEGATQLESAKAALWIYNAILDQSEVLYRLNDQELPLFPSANEQEAFRITTFDFLRLTDVR